MVESLTLLSKLEDLEVLLELVAVVGICETFADEIS